jgi:hypothetical protein
VIDQIVITRIDDTMSTENGVAYPVTKGEATHIPEKILIPSNGVHRGSGTTFSAVCTVNPTDATQLKSENQRLLSELKAMKEQMQVVQGREKGITKAYLGVRRDLDHVSKLCTRIFLCPKG